MRPQLGEAESHAATGEHSLRGTTKARWERERGPVAAGEVARGRRLAMSAGALRRLSQRHLMQWEGLWMHSEGSSSHMKALSLENLKSKK